MTTVRPPRVCVLVPTTARPVPIVDLKAYPALALSTVVSPDWIEDAEVTSRYRLMLQPHGSIGRLLPDVAGQRFVLVLADRIDTGRSWQLPVVCAHLAIAKGGTLTGDPDEADLVIWATGSIAMNVAAAAAAIPIEAHDYALERKVAMTADQFRRVLGRGGRVLALLPPDPGPRPEVDGVRLLSVSQLGEVASILSAAMGEEGPRVRTGHRGVRQALLILSCGMALIGAATMAVPGRPDGSGGGGPTVPPAISAHGLAPAPAVAQPASAEAAPLQEGGIIEAPALRRLIPPPGRTCLNLVLGDARPVETPWQGGDAKVAEERGSQPTCGVAIDHPEGWTVGAVSGIGDLEKTRRLSPGRLVVLFNGQAPREARNATVTLIDGTGQRRDLAFHVAGWRR